MSVQTMRSVLVAWFMTLCFLQFNSFTQMTRLGCTWLFQVFVHEELFHAKFGLLYGGGEQLLVSQFVGMISIAGWTCALMGAFFYVYKRCITCKADIENSLEGNHCHRYGEDLRLSEHVQFSSPQLHEALCALHQKSKTEAKIEQCNPTHAWHVNSVM